MQGTVKLFSRILDFGLNALDQETDRILLCSVEPTSFSQATANALGSRAYSAGGLFGAPADYSGGRKVTSVVVSAGTITTTGTPTCWAAVDFANSRLHAIGVMTPLSGVIAGQGWGLESFSIDMPNSSADWWQSGSALDLDFANNRLWNGSSLGSDFTTYLSCSRASGAYAKTASGTLQFFSNDALRLTTLGLLVEEARTNVLLRSQEFNDAAWTQSNLSSVSANVTTGPDGTTTADKIIPNTSNTFHRVSITGTVSNGVDCAWSVYAKAAGYNFIQIAKANGDGAWFNLATGATGSTAGTITSKSIEALADGWYRCSVTDVSTSTTESMLLSVCNADNVTSFAGDGSSGVYLWGAQLESGTSTSSSYIPTTSATVTRATDVVTLIGAADTRVDALPLSLVMDMTMRGTFAGSGIHEWLGDGLNSDIFFYRGADTQVRSADSGAVVLSANTASATFLDGVKVGYAGASGDRALVMGGGTVATDSNPVTPGASAIMFLSAGTERNPLLVRRLTFWASRLDNATLQSLTA